MNPVRPSTRLQSAAQILRQLSFLQQRVGALEASVRLFCDQSPAPDHYLLHQVTAIQTEIARSLGVSPAALLGHGRRASLVWSRHLAIHLARHLLNLRVSDLGPLFNRDHTSIRHALRCVQNAMDTDTVKRTEVHLMEARVKPLLIQEERIPSHD